MNKVELANVVAERMTTDERKMTKKFAAEVVDAVFAAVSDAMASGEEVSISNFGKFTITERSARLGRNPATGESIEIAASKSPKFKASSVLKTAVKG